MSRARKKQLVDMIVDDMTETVTQWALKDQDSLRQWIGDMLNLESLSEEDLEAQAEGAGLLDSEERDED